MRIRLNQQIRSYNDYANFRVYTVMKMTRVSSAMEAGITKSYYCKVSRVENDAGFNAMEEGITKVIIAAYTVMKMTRVSLQWKRE